MHACVCRDRRDGRIALVCYPAIAIRVEGVSSAVESTSAATNVVKAICGVLFAVIIEVCAHARDAARDTRLVAAVGVLPPQRPRAPSEPWPLCARPPRQGSRIAIVGTIVKAKVAGDEKAKAAIEKAAANEKRRMGRAQ
jgi:hypothetical protein